MADEPNELADLIGMDRASRICGYSYWRFRDFVKEGQIPYVKRGVQYRFRESDVRQWMAEKTVWQTK